MAGGNPKRRQKPQEAEKLSVGRSKGVGRLLSLFSGMGEKYRLRDGLALTTKVDGHTFKLEDKDMQQLLFN